MDNISPFSISEVITDENCLDGQGAIDQTLLTGSGVTYSWSNSAITEDITGLSAGNYTCIVTAPGGCVDTLDYVVVNISGSMVTSAVIYSDTCSSGVGALDFTVASGSGSYDYSWSNTEVTEDINGLTVGMYTVTITDQADNCVAIDSFQVNNVDVIFGGTGVVTNASGSGNADGAINVTLSGTDTYTYDWSNSETTEDVSNLIAGTYTLEVTSSQGCDTTLTFTVGTLSLEENDLIDIKMNIVPNPAIDQFTIKYEFPLEMIGQIAITDGLGRVLQTNQVSGSNELVVDASNMASGVYFVTFRSNKITRMKRLVISNIK